MLQFASPTKISRPYLALAMAALAFLFVAALMVVNSGAASAATAPAYSQPNIFTNQRGGIYVSGKAPDYSTLRVMVDRPGTAPTVTYQAGVYGGSYFQGYSYKDLGEALVCVGVKGLYEVTYTDLGCKTLRLTGTPTSTGTPTGDTTTSTGQVVAR